MLRVHSHVMPFVIVACFICVARTEATSSTSRPSSSDRLLAAQLRVLEMKTLRPPDAPTASQRTETADAAARQYIKDGMPAQAFSPGALKQAALEHLAQKVLLASPATHPMLVAESRQKYGVDPQELSLLLPAPAEDVPGVFDRYIRATDAEDRLRLRNSLAQARVTPAIAKRIIELAEQAKSDEALRAALLVLRNDWSADGTHYLYRRLEEPAAEERQLEVLRVLRARVQILKDRHTKLAEQAISNPVRDCLFQAAEAALSVGQEDAREFVKTEMTSTSVENRRRASDLASRYRVRVGSDVARGQVRAMTHEQDPGRRAEAIRNLGRLAAQPDVERQLLERLSRDASLDVRLAALEAVVLPPVPPVAQFTKDNEELIAKLRDAVGPNAPEALQQALTSKLQEYEERCHQIEQRQQEHRQRAERVMEMMRQQSAQTQSARTQPQATE
jgi:hypothetical protein